MTASAIANTDWGTTFETTVCDLQKIPTSYSPITFKYALGHRLAKKYATTPHPRLKVRGNSEGRTLAVSPARSKSLPAHEERCLRHPHGASSQSTHHRHEHMANPRSSIESPNELIFRTQTPGFTSGKPTCRGMVHE